MVRTVRTGGQSSDSTAWDCVNSMAVCGLTRSTCSGHVLTEPRPWRITDIARDMALLAAHQPPGAAITSVERRRDQTHFRRTASALRKGHLSYAYLTGEERQALATAAGALEKLARASERVKEVREKLERERASALREQAIRDQEAAFERLVHGFDRDSALDRVLALDDFLTTYRGYAEHLSAAIDDCRKNKPNAWQSLTYRVGRLIDEECSFDLSMNRYEAYWREWKASRRVRRAVDTAQKRGHIDPDRGT